MPAGGGAALCAAVSYTHLDVYKRQVFLLVLLAGCRPASQPGAPVEAKAAEAPVDVGAATVSSSGKTPPTPASPAGRSSEVDLRDAADRRDMLELANAVAGHRDAQALTLAALMRTSALPQRRAEAGDSPDHLPKMDRTVRELALIHI